MRFTFKENAPSVVTIAHGEFIRTFTKGEQHYYQCDDWEWERIVRPCGYFEEYEGDKED